MKLAKFPRLRITHCPTRARADDAPVAGAGRPQPVDQARRLHRAGQWRQQDAQARIPDGATRCSKVPIPSSPRARRSRTTRGRRSRSPPSSACKATSFSRIAPDTRSTTTGIRATCCWIDLLRRQRVRGPGGHRHEPGHGRARRRAARRVAASRTSSRAADPIRSARLAT